MELFTSSFCRGWKRLYHRFMSQRVSAELPAGSQNSLHFGQPDDPSRQEVRSLVRQVSRSELIVIAKSGSLDSSSDNFPLIGVH